MVAVADLVQGPGLEGVRVVAGPGQAVPVTAAVVAERAIRVAAAPAGAVCLLTAAASEIESYQLDMCLRAAAAAGTAAVALYGLDDRPPPRSAQQIAERGAVALLAVPDAIDPGSFCIAAQRAIDGDATLALARLDQLNEQLARLDPETSPEDIAALASELLEARVGLASPGPDADGFASDVIVAAGRPLHRVEAEGAWAGLAAALCASAATRRIEAARRSEEEPIRSRAGVLAEILLGGRGDVTAVAERARELGIPVDGWHVATQIDIEPTAIRAARTTRSPHTRCARRSSISHCAPHGHSARGAGPGRRCGHPSCSSAPSARIRAYGRRRRRSACSSAWSTVCAAAGPS